jgi:hypothetical protein
MLEIMVLTRVLLSECNGLGYGMDELRSEVRFPAEVRPRPSLLFNA